MGKDMDYPTLLAKLEAATNWNWLLHGQQYAVTFCSPYSNVVLTTHLPLSLSRAAKLIKNDPFAILEFYEDVSKRRASFPDDSDDDGRNDNDDRAHD